MELQGRSLRGDFLRFVIPSVISQWLFSLYAMVDAIFVSRGVSEVALGCHQCGQPLPQHHVLHVADLRRRLLHPHCGASGEGGAEGGGGGLHPGCGGEHRPGPRHHGGSAALLGPFCRFLGGTEANIGYIRAYIRHLAPFAVFFGLGYAFEILVKVDGFPRYATGCIISGCLLNCLLDYLLVLRFPFGVEGAAVATAPPSSSPRCSTSSTSWASGRGSTSGPSIAGSGTSGRPSSWASLPGLRSSPPGR